MDRIGEEWDRTARCQVFLNSFEVKSTMGITDQRGEWRRVVTDGSRPGQGQDESSRSVEGWGATDLSEHRGIRLLPDSDAVRPPGRVGTSDGGRAIGEREESGHDPVPDADGDAGRGEGP